MKSAILKLTIRKVSFAGAPPILRLFVTFYVISAAGSAIPIFRGTAPP